jgi:hypothetical protein
MQIAIKMLYRPNRTEETYLLKAVDCNGYTKLKTGNPNCDSLVSNGVWSYELDKSDHNITYCSRFTSAKAARG